MINERDFASAMSQGPDAIFSRIAERLKAAPGYDLFTILAPDESGTRLDRLYSTNLVQYPLGAADEVKDDLWFRRLFVDRLPIVANTLDDIGAWLPDYQIFVEQNYSSLLNLPVLFAGRTIGLVNMMGGDNHFDAAALEKIGAALPAAALGIFGATCKLPAIAL